MLGAIAGDIIGSTREWAPVKTVDFELIQQESTFTDDSVLTVATAEAILSQEDYASAYKACARNYPGRGYGGHFAEWIHMETSEPYNSFGNGSAMRVSPVGWAFDSLDEVMKQAKASAEVTHSHPEGIKGAVATAGAIFLARTGKSKKNIQEFATGLIGYELSRTLKNIRPDYEFDVTCQGSVPESIICFLESTDYESTVRNAISLGGDADTMAAIAGSIAEAFYGGVPKDIEHEVWNRLDDNLTGVIQRFMLKHMV
jgi:ADP-ribosylglycohydrolase